MVLIRRMYHIIYSRLKKRISMRLQLKHICCIVYTRDSKLRFYHRLTSTDRRGQTRIKMTEGDSKFLDEAYYQKTREDFPITPSSHVWQLRLMKLWASIPQVVTWQQQEQKNRTWRDHKCFSENAVCIVATYPDNSTMQILTYTIILISCLNLDLDYLRSSNRLGNATQ